MAGITVNEIFICDMGTIVIIMLQTISTHVDSFLRGRDHQTVMVAIVRKFRLGASDLSHQAQNGSLP